MTDTPKEQLLVFPCDYPVKAMGLNSPGFCDYIIDLIKQYDPEIERSGLTTRASKNGKYISVSVTITATSNVQLESLAKKLTTDERVVMSL